MLTDALAGCRCIEIGDSVAAAWCARLLADFGAEVIRVEPPGGSALRALGPLPRAAADSDAGGLFCYLNTNKLGVTADLTRPQGLELLDRLARTADVVIWGSDNPAGESLPRPGGLAERHPHLVVTAVTPFGLVGPYSDWPGNETAVQAVSGLLGVTPKVTGGTDKEPLKLPGHIGSYAAGLHAAFATLGALWSTERGRVLDMAQLDTLMPCYTPVFTQHEADPSLVFSHRTPATGWSIVPCKDGYVLIAGLMDEPWERLMEAMGRPAWADSPVFATNTLRTQNWDAALAAMQPWLNQHERSELFEIFQSHGGTSSPVYTIAEAVDLDQFAQRNFLVPLDPGRFGAGVLMPGVPFAGGQSAEYIRRTAPAAGADNCHVYSGMLGVDEAELIEWQRQGVI